MKLTEPIIFEPLYMERVWGGRRLEELYGKRLPGGARIGESWELVDREEAQSVVHSGALRGLTLHELWVEHRAAVFGARVRDGERFPLLVKLLDAQERLSVQVHPPARVAGDLGGEPKTEMWFIADTHPDSDIFAGLAKGVGREEFESALHDGKVAEKLHRVPVRAGDAIFIPSGRVHAIGAGNLIVEVQQNSDTTYRVFDWNRVGLDGQARALHIEQSMASIDFDDVEPALARPDGEVLVECEDFRVEKWDVAGERTAREDGEFAIFVCLAGGVECGGMNFKPGEFFLVPATMSGAVLRGTGKVNTVLRAMIP